MIHEIETNWQGKMQFNANINGHTIVMDAPERTGGENKGPIPKPFVLSALSGCTGMDVVALLRKAEKQIDNFTMKVTGEISNRAPIEYTAIHIQYNFHGKEEHKEATLSAVTDSQEKYCGVSHMLKKIMPLTWEIRYNDQEIFNNKKEMLVNQDS